MLSMAELEPLPKHDAMRAWYWDEAFNQQTGRALRNAGFVWHSIAFRKAGASYVIHVGLDHEPRDDEIAKWTKVQSDLREVSRSMDPAAPADFILAGIVEGPPVLRTA